MLKNSRKKASSRRQSRVPRLTPTTKRDLIVEAAMGLFAERGYHATRMDELAAVLRIAKGSIFQYFGTKETLFLEVYKKAARSLRSYLDVPPDVLGGGSFEILRYWLTHTEHLVHENWIPYRVLLLGNYETDLRLKKQINRFLAVEDPFGRVAFARAGIESGDFRKDLDVETIVSLIDWVVERFQDALLVEELDPGLFRRHGLSLERNQAKINQFLDILRRAIGRQTK